MKNLLILLFATCLITACQKPTKKVTIESPVDSLGSIWNNAWNNHDSLAVVNMFEPTGTFIDGNSVAKNHDELLKLIRPDIKHTNNIKTERIQEWSTTDRAGSSGLWELDYIVNDSLIGHPKGAFTVNWRKTENGEWKISNAHINSFIEEK